MKKISLINKTFQFFIYVFRLCFDAMPEVKPKPTLKFISDVEREINTLKLAARNFELNKRGAR